ncbi:Uncharacterized protein dnl_36520 [Desulfonema limicola]|uniref:Uncharacterized protein n=2 Tax=Desulfonema limicola TaxID=45656 RepID=A0A975B975_9BACT|nr:Uncharacterized protein dnl_36520 [Desulfonema limicola]
MGMAHILWIYEDGLRTYNREKTKEAVGESVMSACLESKRKLPVLGAINCINRAASVRTDILLV